jgi:asparagine synthase (glutamine-hydrolysing)
MCGIAGILGRVGETNRSALERMATCMSHRGPDSAGFWTSDADERGHGCMFAHRRLSILDLSTAADQPMVDPVTGNAIVFNGEIYNFQDVRGDLQAEGQGFTSTGDTAVMLRLLSLKGPESVGKLRGMFAFGMWDPKARHLTAARDPLGIKPLYICRNPDPEGDWSLLFASEVRAILASGLIGTPKLDPAAVASVVWNGFVMGPGTIVKGIEQLWPGEIRVFDARGREKSARMFWTTPPPKRRHTDEAALREALHESVRLHLISDVPLGVFLSSGVDSSAVANLAQRNSDRPVNTFTLAFEEEAMNEGGHARRIAEAIGTSHREVMLTESHFVANLERALGTLDQPTFDGLNSFYMSQAVREAGLTVALVGTGGDELFGGYTSFRDLPKLARLSARTGFIPRSLRVAGSKVVAKLASRGSSSAAVAPQTRWAKLPDMVRAGQDILELYQLAYALFLPAFQSELIDPDARTQAVRSGLPEAMHERLHQEIAGRSRLSAISVLEQRCFLAERLLRDSDAASMAVSLELRLPLVDSVLLEHVVGLDDDIRYQPVGRKAILRRIGLEGLDPALFDRPKSGFVLPFDRWIRQALGQRMDQTMRDPAACRAVGLNGSAVARLWQAYQDRAPGMYWSRVWAIYVLIRWCQQHGVTL